MPSESFSVVPSGPITSQSPGLKYGTTALSLLSLVFVLTSPIEVDGDGWLTLSDRPGLGCDLAEDVLVATRQSAATFS